MRNFTNLQGLTFGQLTVVGLGIGKGKETVWDCLCTCGGTKVVETSHLIRGAIKTCGCGSKSGFFQRTHGLIHTRTYHSWMAMRKRCSNKKEYPTYYLNGITVCTEWQNDFVQFFNDMGHPPTDKHTLERKDNKLGYFKENCRWATPKEQNRNYSQNKILEFNGKSQCVTGWAEELGIDRFLIYNRLQKGWSIEKALTTPKKFQTKNNLQRS